MTKKTYILEYGRTTGVDDFIVSEYFDRSNSYNKDGGDTWNNIREEVITHYIDSMEHCMKKLIEWQNKTAKEYKESRYG